MILMLEYGWATDVHRLGRPQDIAARGPAMLQCIRHCTSFFSFIHILNFFGNKYSPSYVALQVTFQPLTLIPSFINVLETCLLWLCNTNTYTGGTWIFNWPLL
jgi:hypothetical protein